MKTNLLQRQIYWNTCHYEIAMLSFMICYHCCHDHHLHPGSVFWPWTHLWNYQKTLFCGPRLQVCWVQPGLSWNCLWPCFNCQVGNSINRQSWLKGLGHPICRLATSLLSKSNLPAWNGCKSNLDYMPDANPKTEMPTPGYGSDQWFKFDASGVSNTAHNILGRRTTSSIPQGIERWISPCFVTLRPPQISTIHLQWSPQWMDGPAIWEFHNAMVLHMDSPVCISLPAQQGYIFYSYLDDCEVENASQLYMRLAFSSRLDHQHGKVLVGTNT